MEHERNGEEVGQMMVIRVVLEVGPEHRVAFREHMAQESGRVRSMEGCMRYELYADPSNEDRFLLYEEWSSPGAFETFQASDLLRESFAVLVPMMTGPPDSAYYQARLQPQ